MIGCFNFRAKALKKMKKDQTEYLITNGNYTLLFTSCRPYFIIYQLSSPLRWGFHDNSQTTAFKVLNRHDVVGRMYRQTDRQTERPLRSGGSGESGYCLFSVFLNAFCFDEIMAWEHFQFLIRRRSTSNTGDCLCAINCLFPFF